MRNILVTGALGQIGSELTLKLRERYGHDNVIASDIKRLQNSELEEWQPYYIADCTHANELADIVKEQQIDTIYHLAAILSAVAERDPLNAWNINVNGLLNVLEVSKSFGCAVFTPSSIGAFGPSTPSINTPQDTIQRPETMYGITKVSGELLCDYYHKKYGIDTRGLRYPGLISYKTLPGGGTTDYAVEIYYEAIRKQKYTCYLNPGTYLDMMYMPDAIKAAIELMEANPDNLIHRNAFNVSAMSVAPEDIANEIKTIYPDFSIEYKSDPVRQAIADSWPNNMDDSCACEEWGWKPSFNLKTMTKDMIEHLTIKLH
ncbi:L-threonine 3-dehydrogenase [candidate division KSB1 bacterium]|nr:L-threonine 3-dehydrogenase [candidate division KSB1 bacterium]